MIGQVFTTNSVVLWSEQLISEGYKGEEGGPTQKTQVSTLSPGVYGIQKY